MYLIIPIIHSITSSHPPTTKTSRPFPNDHHRNRHGRRSILHHPICNTPSSFHHNFQGLAKHIISVFASHSNLNCIVQALETNSAFLLICEKQPFHLCDMISFSEHSSSDVTKLFICYQMLQALSHCHEHGITHGNLEPSKILLSRNKLWVYMCGFECPSVCRVVKEKSM